MTLDALATLLQAADGGTPVATLARAHHVSQGAVYSLLRKHRPNRTRSPRTATSDVPAKVRALRLAGVQASRVAMLLGVTRQYVHRICSAGKGTT